MIKVKSTVAALLKFTMKSVTLPSTMIIGGVDS